VKEIIHINFRVMKTNTFLLVMLLASCNLLSAQVVQDSISAHHVYAPNHFNNSFSAEESWEIHKAAYIKQLQSEGLSEDAIERSMVTYEKDKEEFIAQVKEQYRLAAIQRELAAEQRALAEIERNKASELRKLAAIQRDKADVLRDLAEVQRKLAEDQRGASAIQREKAAELRKQAEVQRAKADVQRKLAEIQREKAEVQRKKAQAWRDNTKNILRKNITLTNNSNNSKPITFNVTAKTTVHIGIRAHISSGATLVEVYNPKGVKEGELSLNFRPNAGSNEERDGLEHTSGSLDKTISGAEVGEWQIKISSQKAEGTLAMSVAQYIKPTMNE
jgi:hypothetical protein